MPRRRPPVEIFTFPIPESLVNTAAPCPACYGEGKAYGWIGARLVFKCGDCGVRFKTEGPGRDVSRGESRTG